MGNHMYHIPVIDISALSTSDHASKQKVVAQLGEAASDIGFFCVINHGISEGVIEDTYRAAKDFFAQSDAYKLQYYIGDNPNHRGYVPFTEKGDYADEMSRNYEAFDLGPDQSDHDFDETTGNLLTGPNVWPSRAGFQDRVQGYFRAVSTVGQRLCHAFERYLELPTGAITNQMTNPISQLRLLHYMCDTVVDRQASVNMGAHTDYECLTLLHTRNEGLQILTRDSKWVDVPVIPNALVVNIGDMLEAWSNGILRATPHRVINRQPERFSIPYFVAPNYDVQITPFETLVGTKERVSTHYTFTAGQHLERMLLRDFPYLRKREKTICAAPQGTACDTYQNPFEQRFELHRI